MTDMAQKIQTLGPEIVLMVAAFGVMLLGLSPVVSLRRATYPISAIALVVSALVAAASPAMGVGLSSFELYAKVAIPAVGLLLLLAAAEVPEESGGEIGEQERRRAGRTFDPTDTSRGEFFGFLLLSLVGAMLCAGADDLIWLFLALELTSLPTYVMVTTSRQNIRAPEAAVKYFFLGALAVAVFLYGFALLYAATGTTYIGPMAETLGRQGVGPLATAGLVLAVVGIGFKIAAVPMHFYAADVYQGAATPVAAFLAFVPKAAGFLALIVLLSAVGWPLTESSPLAVALLWALAVLTMFVGNTVALWQDNVKRVLAYSSIAHSGYMLVGVVAGPGAVGGGELAVRNGISAVLFYLVAYGVMNLGAFAVLGLLKRRGEEAETFEDLKGLAARRPALAAVMAVCVLSLTGIPPLVGFWGKVYLVGAAIGAGYYTLAVLTVVASAIAAFYYLRIIGACYLQAPVGETRVADLPSRSASAGLCAVAVVALSLGVGPLLGASRDAGGPFSVRSAGTEPVQAADAKAGRNLSEPWPAERRPRR